MSPMGDGNDPWQCVGLAPVMPLDLNSRSCATMDAVDSSDENICDPLAWGKLASAGLITHTNSSSSSSAAEAAAAAAAE